MNIDTVKIVAQQAFDALVEARGTRVRVFKLDLDDLTETVEAHRVALEKAPANAHRVITRRYADRVAKAYAKFGAPRGDVVTITTILTAEGAAFGGDGLGTHVNARRDYLPTSAHGRGALMTHFADTAEGERRISVELHRRPVRPVARDADGLAEVRCDGARAVVDVLGVVLNCVFGAYASLVVFVIVHRGRERFCVACVAGRLRLVA